MDIWKESQKQLQISVQMLFLQASFLLHGIKMDNTIGISRPQGEIQKQ